MHAETPSNINRD